MRNNSLKLFFLSLLVWSLGFTHAEASNTFTQEADSFHVYPTRVQALESRLAAGILMQYHYSQISIGDSLSSVIYDQFLDQLDNSRVYFTQSDIQHFEKYRNKLDDYIKLGYLLPVYEIYNTFIDRFQERMDYMDSLDFRFDYSKNEYYETERDSIPWPATKQEAESSYRKMMKGQAISLKLAGKADSAITSTLKNRLKRIQTNIHELRSEDVFQLFMNTVAESFDPHTNYFSPITTENFKINMSNSLEGIGATLSLENDVTKIVSVVPGGPAFESKMLHENDRIIGVAQGKDGDFQDVIGWRLDDVVQLIRGPKGSVVRLQIIPAGQPMSSLPLKISLVRDKIKLESQLATSDTLDVEEHGKHYKLGVINVPSFYFDYEAAQKGEKDYNSTTRDVKRLITQLKSAGVQGIIMDLRFNGGGSLQEALALSGLFIPKGPVVQVKNTDGSLELGKDPDPNLFYGGPLMVLTNRFSASASEIFTGAMQDYKRGLVVGEQTYGKGSVQNLIPLNKFVPNEDDKLGQLKLTLAKFYRVTGSSTQLRGVTPDISFPSMYSAKEFGESANKSALPWDHIASSDFTPTNKVTADMIKKLNAGYQQDLKDKEFMQQLKDDIALAKAQQVETRMSLNLTERKAEQDELEKKREAQSKVRGKLGKVNMEAKGTDDKIKDPYLREGVVLMTQLVDMWK